jgi:hypothetical protein
MNPMKRLQSIPSHDSSLPSRYVCPKISQGAVRTCSIHTWGTETLSNRTTTTDVSYSPRQQIVRTNPCHCAYMYTQNILQKLVMV